MDLKAANCRKRKKTVNSSSNNKRKKVQPRPLPKLFDEIVWEILIRLPVGSLVRFKSVCKAWHAIISDPLFVRAHLHLSKQRQKQNPSSFLVTPQRVLSGNMEAVDSPTTPFSTDIRFYRWDLQTGSGSSSATLVCRRQFPAGEFRSVCYLAHCDGLVLLPTNTKTYVFNPATRSVVALPESQRNRMMRRVCLPIGIGFDASIGRYKVARSFYRSCHRDYKTSGMLEMGMEVFTIGGEEDGSWRETLADPPCPMLSSQTGKHCKGHLFYFINKEKMQQPPPRGLLRFSLEDETFGITLLPSNMDLTVQDADILLKELDDELCCTYFSENLQQLMIWSTGDVLNPQWSCRYIISGLGPCYPMASLGNNGILFRQYTRLFRYYLEDAHRVREVENFNMDMDDLRYLGPGEDTLGSEWENMWYYDVISYTESLVPVTHKMSSEA